MVCEDFWVENKCMQFYSDTRMYTLSVSVCTLLIHNVTPLYETHGHKAVLAIERHTFAHMYTLFDNFQ